MIIKNARIFLDEPGTFEQLDIKIEDGIIVELAPSIEGADIVNAENCYVTPGIIEAHSHIGMYEEGIMWEGDDICENEPVTPEMRAIDAFYPGDMAFDDAISGGVTTMCTNFGSGGVVAGTSVIIENNGSMVADELVLVPDAAMKCAFGENPRWFGKEKRQPNTRGSVAFLLRKCLQDAVDYKAEKEAALEKGDHFKTNFGMEAMVRVINGEIPIKAHCHRSDDICTAIRTCKEFGVRATLDHCTDGHLVAEHVAKSGYPAI